MSSVPLKRFFNLFGDRDQAEAADELLPEPGKFVLERAECVARVLCAFSALGRYLAEGRHDLGHSFRRESDAGFLRFRCSTARPLFLGLARAAAQDPRFCLGASGGFRSSAARLPPKRHSRDA